MKFTSYGLWSEVVLYKGNKVTFGHIITEPFTGAKGRIGPGVWGFVWSERDFNKVHRTDPLKRNNTPFHCFNNPAHVKEYIQSLNFSNLCCIAPPGSEGLSPSCTPTSQSSSRWIREGSTLAGCVCSGCSVGSTPPSPPGESSLTTVPSHVAVM